MSFPPLLSLVFVVYSDPSFIIYKPKTVSVENCIFSETKFRAEPQGAPLRPYGAVPPGPGVPPDPLRGSAWGSWRPYFVPAGPGAAPRGALGVLPLPGDGGHLTDFVPN